jgi:hypothetical protein
MRVTKVATNDFRIETARFFSGRAIYAMGSDGAYLRFPTAAAADAYLARQVAKGRHQVVRHR